MAKKQKQTADLAVEQWPIEKVLPYAQNARLHSPEQVTAITKSIKEFGFVNPCLVDAEGVLIAGHGRILGAKSIGMKTVPVIRLGHLTEQQARALRIADNQLPMLATWDAALMKSELESLQLDGYDVNLLGFDNYQLAEFMSPPNAGLTDPEEVPEPPKKPIVRKGDLWMLGDHRLYCGDSTNADDVAKVLGGTEAAMVLADPPYGMNLDTRYSKAPRGSARCALRGREPKMRDYRPVIGDNKPFDASPLCACFSTVKEQFWFGADYYRRTLSQDDTDGSWLVWDKRTEQTDTVIGSSFELIWSKQQHKRDVLRFYWNGAFGAADARGRMHPTQKPQGLLAEIITRWSVDHAIIVDPFVGSGTTIIACEMTGRKCIAIEIDPGYCEVSIERWQKFTGQIATLDGIPFDQVTNARRKGRAKREKADEPAKGKSASIRTPRSRPRLAPPRVAPATDA